MPTWIYIVGRINFTHELITQTFLLALEIRETDMRASPYCMKQFSDLPAIKIETPKGKAEYINHQRMYFERSQPLRLALLNKLKQLYEQCQN